MIDWDLFLLAHIEVQESFGIAVGSVADNHTHFHKREDLDIELAVVGEKAGVLHKGRLSECWRSGRMTELFQQGMQSEKMVDFEG